MRTVVWSNRAASRAALLTAFFLLTFALCALAAEPGPDNPRDHFWRRNTSGPGPDIGAMDPRIREIADSFGAGQYQKARDLCDALLTSDQDPALLSQAATYLIESHLAQGDFDAARAAAERLSPLSTQACGQATARINTIEAQYQRELVRLHATLAAAADPAEAAHAQLLIAKCHQRVGRLDLAAKLYERTIDERRDDIAAGKALSQLAAIRLRTAGFDAAVETAVSALNQHQGSRTIVRAAVRSIANTHLAKGDTAAALRSLQKLAESSADSITAQEAAIAIIEVSFGHLGGATSIVDKPGLNDAVMYSSWAVDLLPEGPLQTKAHFHLAWYARWQSRPRAAVAHASKALAGPDLDAHGVAEASTLLRLTRPSGPLPLETLAWLAIACERTDQRDWFGYSPTSISQWQEVARAVDKLSLGQARGSPWAPLAAAYCHLQGGDRDKAIAALQLVRDRWPDRPEARTAALELAPLLTHSGRASEAATICEKLLAEDLPPDLEGGARRELARARLFDGQGDNALDYHYQLIAAAPDSAEAEKAVAVVADVTADCLGARVASEVLSELRDRYQGTAVAAMAGYELARLGSASGLTVWNARDYLAVIRKFPESGAADLAAAALKEGAAEIVANLADLHSRAQHYQVVVHFGELAPYLAELAPAALSQAIVEFTSSASSSGQLAEEAKPAVAALLRTAACRDNPDKLALLYHTQGDLQAQTGDWNSARDSWRLAVESCPDSKPAAEAALELGRLCLDARSLEQAAAAYRLARGAVRYLSPEERAHAMVGLGETLATLGRYEEAAYEFDAAIALAPSSQIAQDAAQALERLRRTR